MAAVDPAAGRSSVGEAAYLSPSAQEQIDALRDEILALQKRLAALEGTGPEDVEAATIEWIETGDRSRLDDIVRRGGRL